MNYLWVVEVAWNKEFGWYPTINVATTREEGRFNLQKCKSDGMVWRKYRLVKYVKTK